MRFSVLLTDVEWWSEYVSGGLSVLHVHSMHVRHWISDRSECTALVWHTLVLG